MHQTLNSAQYLRRPPQQPTRNTSQKQVLTCTSKITKGLFIVLWLHLNCWGCWHVIIKWDRIRPLKIYEKLIKGKTSNELKGFAWLGWISNVIKSTWNVKICALTSFIALRIKTSTNWLNQEEVRGQTTEKSKSCPYCSFNPGNIINLNQSSHQAVWITSSRGNPSPCVLTNQR